MLFWQSYLGVNTVKYEVDTEFETLAKRFQEKRAEIRKKKELELQDNLKQKQHKQDLERLAFW